MRKLCGNCGHADDDHNTWWRKPPACGALHGDMPCTCSEFVEETAEQVKARREREDRDLDERVRLGEL